MVTDPLVAELTRVVSPKVGCFNYFTLGEMSNPSLAWKKAGVFKINDDYHTAGNTLYVD